MKIEDNERVYSSMNVQNYIGGIFYLITRPGGVDIEEVLNLLHTHAVFVLIIPGH
jgi:hypothetical protein